MAKKKAKKKRKKPKRGDWRQEPSFSKGAHCGNCHAYGEAAHNDDRPSGGDGICYLNPKPEVKYRTDCCLQWPGVGYLEGTR